MEEVELDESLVVLSACETRCDAFASVEVRYRYQQEAVREAKSPIIIIIMMHKSTTLTCLKVRSYAFGASFTFDFTHECAQRFSPPHRHGTEMCPDRQVPAL